MSARFFNLNGKDYVMVEADTYNRLLQTEEKLSLLEAHGVDNWQGYSEAMCEFYDNELGD